MFQKIILTLGATVISTQLLAKDIALPKPHIAEDISLNQALHQRHSDHAFANKTLDNQMLSNILWAAYGVNRPDERRTIPTARNEKDLNIYVFKTDGIFLYDAPTNTLKQVSTKNALGLFQQQDYMKTVPVVFVYTGSHEDYSAMHAGSAYQNVGLYTATNGLANIVRGSFDKQGVAKALNLPAEQRVIVSQALGWQVDS